MVAKIRGLPYHTPLNQSCSAVLTSQTVCLGQWVMSSWVFCFCKKWKGWQKRAERENQEQHFVTQFFSKEGKCPCNAHINLYSHVSILLIISWLNVEASCTVATVQYTLKGKVHPKVKKNTNTYFSITCSPIYSS